MSAVLWDAFEQIEALAGVSAASVLTGIARSSVYRWPARDKKPFEVRGILRTWMG